MRDIGRWGISAGGEDEEVRSRAEQHWILSVALFHGCWHTQDVFSGAVVAYNTAMEVWRQESEKSCYAHGSGDEARISPAGIAVQ